MQDKGVHLPLGTVVEPWGEVIQVDWWPGKDCVRYTMKDASGRERTVDADVVETALVYDILRTGESDRMMERLFAQEAMGSWNTPPTRR